MVVIARLKAVAISVRYPLSFYLAVFAKKSIIAGHRGPHARYETDLNESEKLDMADPNFQYNNVGCDI